MIHQTPTLAGTGISTTVAAMEALLAEWFEGEVILTSCGRAAILLWLSEIGLNRYRDRVAVPRMISGCVMEAVIQRAFPVEPGTTGPSASAVICYHQYGYPQVISSEVDVPIIEDICHAFFAGPRSGARSFVGSAIVFSLPKFFGTVGMVGGLVTRDLGLATRLRAARDAAEEPSIEQRQRHRLLYAESSRKAADLGLMGVYLERLHNPRIRNEELEGLPNTLEELIAVGEQREGVWRRLDEIFVRWPSPVGWTDGVCSALPFLYPVFGDYNILRDLEYRLDEAGFVTGIYQIDVARNMYRPEYRPALLVPCHHEIAHEDIARIGDLTIATSVQ